MLIHLWYLWHIVAFITDDGTNLTISFEIDFVEEVKWITLTCHIDINNASI